MSRVTVSFYQFKALKVRKVAPAVREPILGSSKDGAGEYHHSLSVYVSHSDIKSRAEHVTINFDREALCDLKEKIDRALAWDPDAKETEL